VPPDEIRLQGAHSQEDEEIRVDKEVFGMPPASARAHRDQDLKTRFLPGYVDGKEEQFSGRLSGVTLSYEFTERGKPMAGRTYYLQAEGSSVYVLRFTGLRDKLSRIRNQTDLIARSVRQK